MARIPVNMATIQMRIDRLEQNRHMPAWAFAKDNQNRRPMLLDTQNWYTF